MSKHTDGMSQAELIGQLLVVGFYGTTVPPEIVDLIQRQHVGNIILFTRNVQDAQQLFALTHELQMIAQKAGHRYPLLITIDQENGMVRRLKQSATIFPGNMALGAIGSEQIAYDVAHATGLELKALGINMNLAPVVDVNNNPDNPVIGIRSFGEDPQAVARLAAATIRGYHDAGVLTSLKHFPGHGDTAVDSHLSLPTVPFALERLEQLELIPFVEGIAAGADSVMIAHLYLPLIMQQAMLPSTVSPEIIRTLLREKLGFKGVVISDCLEMNAVAETIGTEQGALMALQAGNDLILISHTYTRQQGGIAAIQAALQTGELVPEAIQQAAERVLAMKARTLSWDTLPTEEALAIIGNSAHQQLRDHAYQLSTTLVRNDASLIPLHLESSQQILVIFSEPTNYSMAIEKDFSGEAFVESIRQYHSSVNVLYLAPSLQAQSVDNRTEDQAIYEAAQCADVIIMVTLNANLDLRQATLLQNLLQAGHAVIGVAAYNPYDLLAYPQLATYLVTYEYTQPALVAAVQVIFGETPASGSLPVSIPGLYALHL